MVIFIINKSHTTVHDTIYKVQVIELIRNILFGYSVHEDNRRIISVYRTSGLSNSLHRVRCVDHCPLTIFQLSTSPTTLFYVSLLYRGKEFHESYTDPSEFPVPIVLPGCRTSRWICQDVSSWNHSLIIWWELSPSKSRLYPSHLCPDLLKSERGVGDGK